MESRFLSIAGHSPPVVGHGPPGVGHGPAGSRTRSRRESDAVAGMTLSGDFWTAHLFDSRRRAISLIDLLVRKLYPPLGENNGGLSHRGSAATAAPHRLPAVRLLLLVFGEDV